jgi:hypothetical protein
MDPRPLTHLSKASLTKQRARNKLCVDCGKPREGTDPRRKNKPYAHVLDVRSLPREG